MQRRLLAEGLLELVEVELGDRRGVERLDPLGEAQRSLEGQLDRDLLIEEHADQQRERLVGEQPVGRLVAGDVQGGQWITTSQGSARSGSMSKRAIASVTTSGLISPAAASRPSTVTTVWAVTVSK